MKISFTRLYICIFLVLFVIIGGILGYYFIENYNLIDSVYMTIITVGTVGFGVIKPLTDAGKIFTSLLIVSSLVSMGLLVSALTKYILEGFFKKYFAEKKLVKMISKLENHVIVCGYGRNGRETVQELTAHKEPVVVIEKSFSKNEENIGENVFFIEGDATNEELLVKANIVNAKALITAMPNDADNLYAILSARELNREILIISRASDEHAIKKLKHAGANNVILPDKIGGVRMAKLVFQPNIVEFVEQILQLQGDVKIEEIACTNQDYIQKTIREMDLRNVVGVNILGLRKTDGSYLFNPSPEILITDGDTLFVLGNKEQIKQLKHLLQ
jgi:voltage-gated potassium channel